MNNPEKKEDLSEKIKDRIIDYILKSPLNVDFIPDDIEREMYENIFDVIEETIHNDATGRCCNSICDWFKKKSKL